jgi:translation initiation factor 3 subunit C
LLDCIVELLELILPVKDTIFIGESVAEDAETLDKPNFRVRGCILTIVERLDEEFTKLLKECDPHSNDYVQRLVYLYRF